MCKEVRDFKVPGGKEGKVTTIGDLIDRTPKHLISKVMLEEKIFDTWFGGRTVLLGDGMFCLFVIYLGFVLPYSRRTYVPPYALRLSYSMPQGIRFDRNNAPMAHGVSNTM